jgi:hypothetical protein
MQEPKWPCKTEQTPLKLVEARMIIYHEMSGCATFFPHIFSAHAIVSALFDCIWLALRLAMSHALRPIAEMAKTMKSSKKPKQE